MLANPLSNNPTPNDPAPRTFVKREVDQKIRIREEK